MARTTREVSTATTKFTVDKSFRAGLVAVRGTLAPAVYLWGLQKGANDFTERAMGVAPLLVPVVPALAAGFFRDWSVASYVGAGMWYVMGTTGAFVEEFICPSEERTMKQAVRPFLRAVRSPMRFLR